MMEDLNKCDEIFFQDPYNHVVFDSAIDDELFMVGGFVRDILLGRKGFDRDYIVRDDFQKVAARVAIKTGGKLVQIGKRNFFRVLTKNGTSMDFTPMNQDINYDLSGRDFTINALAWSPETGLIDLFNGIEDIRKGLIRGINKENLVNDPARIIRAYRLLGATSFKIEEATRENFERNCS
jgi:tRNA nucleotidyltransferase/poly(A) polymerase